MCRPAYRLGLAECFPKHAEKFADSVGLANKAEESLFAERAFSGAGPYVRPIVGAGENNFRIRAEPPHLSKDLWA